MRPYVLHRQNPTTGTFGKCAGQATNRVANREPYDWLMAGVTIKTEQCMECIGRDILDLDEPLAITRGRVVPQCNAIHPIAEWPFVARCIRDTDHHTPWSYNPGDGPRVTAENEHLDRHGSVWTD